MPAEPRIVPVPCPFGPAGGIVYVYYIDAPQPALVDTGVAASPGAAIEPALNALGLSLKNVKWILATHGHWDHIGGAHTARSMAADDVQVAIHGADAALLQSQRAHMEPGRLPGAALPLPGRPEALARQDAMLMENLSGELIADRELQGGERISLGGDVTVEVVPHARPLARLGQLPGRRRGLDVYRRRRPGARRRAGGFPLYVDPRPIARRQRRLLEDVRPRSGCTRATVPAGGRHRPRVGHRWAGGRGGAARRSGDARAPGRRGPQRVDGIDLAHPTARALAPGRRGARPGGRSPAAWPPSLFTTLHGYLQAGRAPPDPPDAVDLGRAVPTRAAAARRGAARRGLVRLPR